MVPKSFTKKEGGNWERWNHGHVASADLQRYRIDNDNIFINGVMVHSLYFETETGPQRWDCKNGWNRKGML